jgi:hypothetical protein
VGCSSGVVVSKAETGTPDAIKDAAPDLEEYNEPGSHAENDGQLLDWPENLLAATTCHASQRGSQAQTSSSLSSLPTNDTQGPAVTSTTIAL